MRRQDRVENRSLALSIASCGVQSRRQQASEGVAASELFRDALEGASNLRTSLRTDRRWLGSRRRSNSIAYAGLLGVPLRYSCKPC